MNSREKGARRERQWAQYLRDAGWSDADRSARIGKEGAADVIGGPPGSRCEVKGTRKAEALKWMAKLVEELEPGEWPYIAYKPDNRPWVIYMRMGDLSRLWNHEYPTVTGCCGEDGPIVSLEAIDWISMVAWIRR